MFLYFRLYKFPTRTNVTGGVIDTYLKCHLELPLHAAHTLFSANRWEVQPEIIRDIDGGTCVLVDRYVPSGCAYTFAKGGVSYEWCKHADTGLMKPDLTIYLTLSGAISSTRAGYGLERFENDTFMEQVRGAFRPLVDSTWGIVDASGEIPVVHQRVVDILGPIVSGYPGPKVQYWD